MAWYNKYRPRQFSDVIGQDLVKEVLQATLNTSSPKQAYLFSGPKGVGKTTIARIFANSLNQVNTNPETAIDIIEMDAASNTGVEDIRQLIESSNLPPLSGKYKIYIIDEVHMLSKAAMNSLLKTLEEPPEHLIFLLATTNPEKLLPTVLSRLTKLNLQAHTAANIVTKLQQVADAESVSFTEGALEIIAKKASGSQRDALNLLETIASFNLEKYTEDKVNQLLGLPSQKLLQTAAKCILHNTWSTDLEAITTDATGFLETLLEYLLEQSLTKKLNQSLEPVILAASKVLAQKLPLTNVSQIVAITALEYKNITKNLRVTPSNSDIAETMANTMANTTTEQDLKKDIGESQENTKNQTTNAPSKPEEQSFNRADSLHTQNIMPSTESAKESLDSNEDLQKALWGLKDAPKAPFILKLIGLDLGLESFDIKTNSVVISVSSGMFLTQISSAKVIAWMQEQLNSSLGKQFTIRACQRPTKEISLAKNLKTEYINNQANTAKQPRKNLAEDGKKPETKTSYSDINTNTTNTADTSQANPNSSLANEVKTSEKSSKYFYKIYKNPKGNLENSEVPIYNSNLPLPNKNPEPDSNLDTSNDKQANTNNKASKSSEVKNTGKKANLTNWDKEFKELGLDF